MENLLYIDTEYSSFNTEIGNLIQIAIMPVIDLTPQKPFEAKIRPTNYKGWDKNSERVHKITWDMAQLFPEQETIAQQLKDYMRQFDTVFTAVAFNGDGDKKYMGRFAKQTSLLNDWFLKVRPVWRDVLKDARKKVKGTKKYSLSKLCDKFGIDSGGAHDALKDVWMTYRLDEVLKSMPSLELPVETETINMSEVEKYHRFTQRDYIQMNETGEVYLTAKCTRNPEALKVVLNDLLRLYG